MRIRSFKGLIKPTSLNIIPSSISVKMGTTYEIPYTLIPENTTNQKINWSSSDTSIATVSNGIITPVAVGTTTITGVTDYLGFTDTVSIEVYVVPVAGVTLNESSITVEAGETFQLVATVIPSDALEQGVTWSSDNTSVATVSSNGLVTYVGSGNCTITVTTVEGGFTATCSVLCKLPIEEYILLSEGGGINKFNELARSTNNSYPASLFNEGTRWRANVTNTDKFTTMYKSFNKNIVKFEIKFQYTENYSYSSIFFRLQPTNGSTDIGEPGEFDINNGQDTYSGWSGMRIYRGTTKQNYTSSGVTTSDVTVVGEKNGNTWTLTFTGGKNFTYSFDETNNCKRISFGAWRRWTGTQGYFKKVVVYLK